MNFFLDFFRLSGICAHLRHPATRTPVLRQSAWRTPDLPKRTLGVAEKPQEQPHLKKKNNPTNQTKIPSEIFCTYRQVNPRHGIPPRGRERTQAAMAPPETFCSAVRELSSRLYPDLTVTELNALGRGEPEPANPIFFP